MRYLSLFTGIGGFELGIQQAYEKIQDIPNTEKLKHETEDTINSERGLDYNNEVRLGNPICIGYSEIDKYAIETYQRHFPKHKNYGDITKINADELPDFDLLVGGFPCQAFSIAGKRRGFEDTRGTLFFEIARILKAKQPRLFLLENVKGLLSHDNGQTFRTIIATLDELGYDLQWQVLNSKNFGVPQNRERVFIVGHLRGTSRPEVFPIGESTKNNIEVVGELSSETYLRRNESIRRVYSTNGIAPTIPTGVGGGVMPKIANTLDANYYKGNSASSTRHTPRTEVMQDMKIRRLTPKECERLQGFPDNWTVGSDTQRYKQCGNAVTVNVIKAVMERLLSD